MRIIAQMLIRNEADIIVETLTEITRWGLDGIVVLDGGSDDGTIELIEGFDGGVVDLTVSPDPGGRFADHRRQELLDLTRLREPDWIISVDADEIYHTSPVDAIIAADAVDANVAWCDVPQFWLTLDDIRNGLLLEDESVSVQARRRWYSWGHTGVFIWRDHPSHYYPKDIQKRTPEFEGVPDYRCWQVPGPVRPICKHYPFRSLRQAMSRMEERLARGGTKYFGKYELDWLIDEEAVGLSYFQDMHNPEDDDWERICNHEAVCQYMGRPGRWHLSR
jgi:glycosyltransferase involved in cell wall biosynthesis